MDVQNSQAPLGAASHTVENMSPLNGLIGCMYVAFYKHAAPMALRNEPKRLRFAFHEQLLHFA